MEIIAEYVVGQCSDPRESKYSDKMRKEYAERGIKPEKLIIFRNTGAYLFDLERSLETVLASGKTKSIILMQHEDCAANKAVKSALENKEPEPGNKWTSTINRFRNWFKNKHISVDAADIDTENCDMQLKYTTELVKGSKITVESRYVTKSELTPKLHEGISAVMIIEPFYGYYADIASKLGVELGGMYVLQALNVKDLLPSIQLVKKLLIDSNEIKDIKLVGLGNDMEMYGQVAKFVKDAVPGVEVTIKMYNQSKQKM